MRISVFTNAAILAGVAAAQLRLPVVHQPALASSLRRRAAGVEVTAGRLRYSVNVTVGTPPQDISLFVSLDSHTIWAPDAESCDGGNACTGGSFDSSASSSYDDSDHGSFSLYYGDNTSVYGLEFEDTIRVSDIEVTGFMMGLVRNGDFTQGELAIGPSAESDYSLAKRLVEEGVTNSPAYSFWLNDKSGTSGNLLFGAVDTSAFDAPLQLISTHPAESSYVGFPVDFSILNYTDSSGGDPEIIAPQNDLPLVLIRPTDMLTNLPSTLAEKIWDLAGATYDKASGFATIPCSGGADSASELILGLGVWGNATARVSFGDLIVPRDIAPIGSGPDEEMCVFAIQSMSGTDELSDEDHGPWSLGGIVLRNTYTVFDLVNDEVALAPVRFDGESRTHDVVPFPSYGAEIPHSEDAGPLCSTSSPCDRDSPYHDRHSPAPAITALVLMVLGFVLILAGFITLMWFLWYRGYCCFKNRRKEKEDIMPPQSGPISEKILYAGALPPTLSPRPAQPYFPGLPSGQLPPGCVAIPAVAQSAAPAGPLAFNPAEPRGIPSDTQPAGSSASAIVANRPDNPPASRPICPPTSPSDARSADSPSSSQTPAAEGTAQSPESGSPTQNGTGDATPKTRTTPEKP